MDAKRHVAASICVASLIVLCGCELGARMMKADNRKPVEQTEKPIIVEHEGRPIVTQAADPNEDSVRRYVERVDSISRQARQSEDSERAARRDASSATTGSNPRPENPIRSAGGAERQSRETERPAAEPTDQAQTQTPATTSDAEAESAPVAEAVPEHPPVLASLEARGARSGAAADSPPGVNAPAKVAGPSGALKDALAAWLAETRDGSFADQLDRRLAQILSGDYEAARDPLTNVSDHRQKLALGMIDALIAVREGHDGDPSSAANSALHAIEQLSSSLRENSDLEIPVMALCRSVGGFGRYEEIAPGGFAAGSVNEFVSYCEVRNFHSKRVKGGGYETRFSMRTIVMNRGGDTVLDIKDADVLDRCRNLRRDCFLSRVVRLPALTPGEYVVKVTLVDKLGEKVAENRATFRVVAGVVNGS